MSGCDMDLLGVGNCPQMRRNVNHSELKQLCVNEPVKHYMQMVKYTTGVVLKIPVQCSCS